MKFQIWSVGEDSGEFMPLFKELESDDFNQIYLTYLKLSKKGMYMITTNSLMPINSVKNESYIYESPDGGKTLYRRKFLSNNKEQI